MDLSDLPQSAQARIAAVEIEADSILANSHASAKELAERADWGVDPLGIDYLLGDVPMVLRMARNELADGRERAAGHLFGATAGEYLKNGKLDFEGFNAKLETIGDWIAQKYRIDRTVLDQLKQHCRVFALRERAAALEATERAESKKTIIARASELNRDESTRTEAESAVDGANGNETEQRAAINAFISKLAEAGRKITRKNIWTVAGYTNATEFERFQRGDTRTTQSAAAAFNRVLSMKPEDFIRLLDRKPATK